MWDQLERVQAKSFNRTPLNTNHLGFVGSFVSGFVSGSLLRMGVCVLATARYHQSCTAPNPPPTHRVGVDAVGDEVPCTQCVCPFSHTHPDLFELCLVSGVFSGRFC